MFIDRGAQIDAPAYEDVVAWASARNPPLLNLDPDTPHCILTHPARPVGQRRDHPATASIVELYQHRCQLGID